MSGHTWRDVVGYEGLYLVSDQGIVISAKTGRELGSLSSYGYRIVTFYKNGNSKKNMLHRVVLEAFSGIAPSGFQGAHLNHIKTDCRLVNLEWQTPQQNLRANFDARGHAFGEKNGRAKLKEITVLEIRRQFNQGELNKSQISRKYSIPLRTIKDILSNKKWRHL